MEQVELIKLISEFGVLIVIAGLYLYERFMSGRESIQILKDLKVLMTDIKTKNCERMQKSLSIYNFRSAISLYLSSQKCELIKECAEMVAINHIHDDEEITKQKILNLVQSIHERHKDFIDELYFNGKPLEMILDNAEFIQSKIDICTEWVLGNEHEYAILYRQLDFYFERFKIKIEQI